MRACGEKRDQVPTHGAVLRSPCCGHPGATPAGARSAAAPDCGSQFSPPGRETVCHTLVRLMSWCLERSSPVRCRRELQSRQCKRWRRGFRARPLGGCLPTVLGVASGYATLSVWATAVSARSRRRPPAPCRGPGCCSSPRGQLPAACRLRLFVAARTPPRPIPTRTIVAAAPIAASPQSKRLPWVTAGAGLGRALGALDALDAP